MNPRAPQFPVSLRTHIDASRAQLVGKDALPFRQRDWPNPRGPKQPLENLTWLEVLNQGLIGKDALPFRQRDWQNPRGPKQPLDNLTCLKVLNQGLIGKDAFFGLAGKPQFDWPNPRGREHPVALRGWLYSVNTTLLVPPAQGPLGVVAFAPDWPVPLGREYPVALRTWSQSLNTTTLVQVGGPLGVVALKTDWPLPSAARVTPAMLGHIAVPTQNALLSAPSIGSQTDWLNPRGRDHPVALRTWSQSLNTTTLVPDAGPPPPAPDIPVPVVGTGGWYPEIFGYERKRKHRARTIEALEIVFRPAAVAHKGIAARCIVEADAPFCAIATAGGVGCRAWPVTPAAIDCNRARGRYFPGEAEALLALLGYMED